jgi:hypothetical protein
MNSTKNVPRRPQAPHHHRAEKTPEAGRYCDLKSAWAGVDVDLGNDVSKECNWESEKFTWLATKDGICENTHKLGVLIAGMGSSTYRG